jgi:hypothetical protein
MHIYVNMYLKVGIYVSTYVCMHVCQRRYTCMYVRKNSEQAQKVFMYDKTYIHTYICSVDTYINIHTSTYIHMSKNKKYVYIYHTYIRNVDTYIHQHTYINMSKKNKGSLCVFHLASVSESFVASLCCLLCCCGRDVCSRTCMQLVLSQQDSTRRERERERETYIHINKHTYMNIYIHTCTHTYTHTCIHTHVQAQNQESQQDNKQQSEATKDSETEEDMLF